MKTYQTLGLIGGILGILITTGLLLTLSFLFSLTQLGTNSPQQAHQNSPAQHDQFFVGLAFAFLFYIACIVITFVVNNTKVVGSILIGLGVISVAITNGWGIIPFALFLPAGIVAIRRKVGVSTPV